MGLIATVAGHATAGVAAHIVGAVPEAYFKTLTRDADYAWNLEHRTVTVGPGEAVEAFWRSDMGLERLTWILGVHGCKLEGLDPFKGEDNDDISWRWVVAAREPFFEPDVARRMYFRKIISKDEATAHMRRAGLYSQDRRDQFMQDGEMLTPLEYIVAWWRGYIDNEHDLRQNLYARGYNKQEQEWMLKLAQEIPTPSDLVHFAVREVWDADITKEFEHDAEYRAGFDYWMSAQGGNSDARTQAEIDAGAPKVTWGQMHWRAHWVTISPTQAYTMQHRLRPTGGKDGGPRVPGVEPWTLKNTRLALKAQDYPPPFRDRLAAISYNVPTLMHVRMMVRFGLVQDAEAIEMIQDTGYNLSDSGKLLDMLKAQNDAQDLQKIRFDTKSRILRAYEMGAVGKAEACTQLHRLSLRTGGEIRQFDAMNPDEQALAVQQDAAAQVACADIDAISQLASLGEWQSAIKSQFIAGKLNAVQAQQALQVLGVTQAWIDRELPIWALRQKHGDRHARASEHIKWLEQGIITADDFTARLVAQGYPAADIADMLLQAQQWQAAQAVKQAAQAAKAQARLHRVGSPSTLRKWLIAGLITPEQMRARMEQMGLVESDITLSVEDAILAKAAADAKKAGKPK